jgi:hypothetical protein
MTIVYRVEKPDSDQGLWYTRQRTFKPIVHNLRLACAALPMDYDPEYYRDGIHWYSGCTEMADLLQWFSPKELLLLKEQGFELLKFDSEYVRDYGGHQVFSKQHPLSSEYFDIKRLL